MMGDRARVPDDARALGPVADRTREPDARPEVSPALSDKAREAGIAEPLVLPAGVEPDVLQHASADGVLQGVSCKGDRRGCRASACGVRRLNADREP